MSQRSSATASQIAAIVMVVTLATHAHPASQAPVHLDPMGGPGGNPFAYLCGPGRVLVGVTGYAGVWIDSVQAICATDDGHSVFGTRTEGPRFGGDRPSKSSSMCLGNGRAVAALEMDLNKDQPFLGYVAVRCVSLRAGDLAPPHTDMRGTGRLFSESDRPAGSELFLNVVRRECPAGSIAAGIHGRAGRFLDALSLVCGPRPVLPDGHSLLGRFVSLQSSNYPDRYVRHRGWFAYIDPIRDELGRKDATFKVVPALRQGIGSQSRCVSLESLNHPDHFLRHEEYRLKLARRSDHPLFREDASFCMVQGPGTGTSFQSVNVPDRYVRHRSSELWLDPFDGSELFRKDATFNVKPGLE